LIGLRHVGIAGEGAGTGGYPAPDEQDAIDAQILLTLADDEAGKTPLAGKRDVIERMAREALEEDGRGETRPPDELL
jgi:hypothetical protein